MLAAVAALTTAFLAGLAYNGFLQPGDAGRAALIAVAGGAVTVLHIQAALGFFRGWAWSRWVALPVLAVWVVAGLLGFAELGKSSARVVGLVVAVVAASGLAAATATIRRPPTR